MGRPNSSCRYLQERGVKNGGGELVAGHVFCRWSRITGWVHSPHRNRSRTKLEGNLMQKGEGGLADIFIKLREKPNLLGGLGGGGTGNAFA